MDVSAEAADLVVKEGIQATESAVKLAGTGLKNVAALLLALARQEYKVIGQASAARLARDPNPPLVIQIKEEDLPRFRRIAEKEIGVLYLPLRKKGSESGLVSIVSTQTYATSLNYIMEMLGYPAPAKEQGDNSTKKTSARAQQEKSSNERGIGLNPSQKTTDSEQKLSVKVRLEQLKAISEQNRTVEKAHEKIR